MKNILWEQIIIFWQKKKNCGNGGGGDFHIDMVYVYLPAFWGVFSRNLV